MNKLNEIQQKLKVPKSHRNTFANYDYRNAEDILEAVKPLLGEDAVVVIYDDVVMLGDRYYIKATADLIEGGQLIGSSTGYAREPEDKKGSDASQITGAASSYARKYALNGLFLIDDTKDADSDEKAPEKPAAKPEKPKVVANPLTAKKKLIQELCDEIALEPLVEGADYKRWVKQETKYDLIEENYNDIIEALQAMKNVE